MNAPAGATLSPQEVTSRSGSNFLVGFLCLDAPRRAGMTAIYAFCRVADDAVDDCADVGAGRAAVQFWREELAAVGSGVPTTPVGRALAEAVRRFGVECRYLDALLDGMAADLEPVGFADLAQLEQYCWRVASAVGLACLPVLGVTGAVAERYADRLGRALQLTNILRDLRADAEAGRIYVPRDWLQACGAQPGWLRGDGPDSAYRPAGAMAQLVDRLATVAEARFGEAESTLRSLPHPQRRRLLPPRIMGVVYRDLLARLRTRGGELRGPRVRVPKARRLWLAGLVAAGLRA